MDGPDHRASTEPDEFRRLVNSIRNVELCLGTGEKMPTSAEREISKVVTKRVVAKRDICQGDIFQDDNICIKRNDSGALASQWDIVVGKKAGRSYRIDEGIEIF